MVGSGGESSGCDWMMVVVGGGVCPIPLPHCCRVEEMLYIGVMLCVLRPLTIYFLVGFYQRSMDLKPDTIVT